MILYIEKKNVYFLDKLSLALLWMFSTGGIVASLRVHLVATFKLYC